MFSRTLAFGLLASTVSAFDAASTSNVAMYWGQGSNQITLKELCSDPSVDIVNIGFVNEFPKRRGEYPSTNFANACDDVFYTDEFGNESGLRSSCPTIPEGIQRCHDNGKKVLLSIGGGYPTEYYLKTPDIAEYLADFLWGAFGPQDDKWVAQGKPRPFGNQYVDGFDLDLEALIKPAPFDNYLFSNYDKLVKRWKNVHFPSKPGNFYISSAPQCEVPDSRLADAISKAHFDFVFVQFYNTPKCNARRGYEGTSASTTTFTFDNWVTWLQKNSVVNPNVKLYIGLPADKGAAPYDPASYLEPIEANKLIKFYQKKYPKMFGGVMLWEATFSAKNTCIGTSYSTNIKAILQGTYQAKTCPSPTSTAPTSTAFFPKPTGISQDGTCGTANGNTCAGSAFGPCCSQYDYCGSTKAHCEVSTCNPLFGKCGDISSSSSVRPTITSSATLSSSTKVSSSTKASSSSTKVSSSSSTKVSSSSIKSSSSSVKPSSSSVKPSSSSVKPSSSSVKPSSSSVKPSSSSVKPSSSSTKVSSSSSTKVSTSSSSTKVSSSSSTKVSSSVSSTKISSSASSTKVSSSSSVKVTSSSLSSTKASSSASSTKVSSSASSTKASSSASSTKVSSSASSTKASSSLSSTKASSSAPTTKASSSASSTKVSSSASSTKVSSSASSTKVSSSASSTKVSSSLSSTKVSSASSTKVSSSSSTKVSTSASITKVSSTASSTKPSTPASSTKASSSASSTKVSSTVPSTKPSTPASSTKASSSASSTKVSSSSTKASSSAFSTKVTIPVSSTKVSTLSTKVSTSVPSTKASSSASSTKASISVSSTKVSSSSTKASSSISITKASTSASSTKASISASSTKVSTSASSTGVTSSSSSVKPSSLSSTKISSSSFSTAVSSSSSSSAIQSSDIPSATSPSASGPIVTDSSSVPTSSGTGVSIIVPSSSAPFITGNSTIPIPTGTGVSSITSSTTDLGYPSYTGSAPPTFSGPGYSIPSSETPAPSASKAEDDYPAGKPSVTSEPTPATSKPAVTTTTYTTTYIDLCPTGFTTATATITKTYTACSKCDAPKPTSNEVPEGWYTTIAVCGNCGPRTTTVTLTKPYATPTEAAYEPAHPSVAAYPPHSPSEGEDVSSLSSKIYVTVVPVPTSEAPAATPSSYVGSDEDGSENGIGNDYENGHVSATVQVPSGVASSTVARSTVAPVYSGTTAPVHEVAPSTSSLPAQYEGAANRFSVGVSGVMVFVVGGLLL